VNALNAKVGRLLQQLRCETERAHVCERVREVERLLQLLQLRNYCDNYTTATMKVLQLRNYCKSAITATAQLLQYVEVVAQYLILSQHRVRGVEQLRNYFATYCNTLLHAATHARERVRGVEQLCNYFATYCNTLPDTATHMRERGRATAELL